MGRTITDAELAHKAEELIALGAKEGINLRVTSGTRTADEQAALFAQGRTAPGRIVTNAPPGRSRHETGRAFDIVPLNAKGQADWESPSWSRVGQLGKSLGLEWGGDWTSFKDRPHFQLPGKGLVTAVTKAISPREASAATLTDTPNRAALEQELGQVRTRIQLLEELEQVRARIKTLESQTPTAQAAERPIVGTQQVMGMEVPIRQPASLEQLKTAQAANPTAQANSPIPAVAELLPTVGEIGGAAIGNRFGGGVGAAVGGAVGAGAGKLAEIGIKEGRLATPQEVGIEVGLSALPEGAAYLLGGPAKKVAAAIARGTPGGLVLRREEAARLGRAGAEQIFQPAAKSVVDNLFSLVRQSGVKIDTAPLQHFFTTIGSGKTQALLSDAAHFDLKHRTGGRYQQLLQGIIAPQGQVRIVGADIGELQNLRSQVRQLAEQVDSPESRDLLNRFRETVDMAIESGKTVGNVAAGNTPQILQEARRQYARLRASEDFATLVERHITTTPDLKVAQLNPRALADALRKDAGGLASTVNDALDKTPGGRQRFMDMLDEMASQFSTIEMPMSDVAGLRRFPMIAGLSQALSDFLLSDRGRSMLKDAILRKPGATTAGVLPLQTIAVIANAVRREALPQPQSESGVVVDPRGIRPGNMPILTTPPPMTPQRQ